MAISDRAKRLHDRDHDPKHCKWRDTYLDKLPLATVKRVFDVGCGVGFVARSIAARADFTGEVIGVDLAEDLIEAAASFAGEEDLRDVSFLVGNVEQLDFPAGHFDSVIAHTTLSHVSQPAHAVHELARVAHPDGQIVIFDGDDAALTIGYPDADTGQRMASAVVDVTTANPDLIRSLPTLLYQAGLEIIDAAAYVDLYPFDDTFLLSYIERIASQIIERGRVTSAEFETWLVWQKQASTEKRFFASTTYYTFVVKHL